MRKLITNIQPEQPFTKEDWQFLQDAYAEPIAKIIQSAGNSVVLTGAVLAINDVDDSGSVSAGFVAINGEVIEVTAASFPAGTFVGAVKALLNVQNVTTAPSPRTFPDASSQVMHINTKATVVAANPATFPTYPVLNDIKRFGDSLVLSASSSWVVTGDAGAPVFQANASAPLVADNVNTIRTKKMNSQEVVLEGACVYTLATATSGNYKLMQIVGDHRPSLGHVYRFPVVAELRPSLPGPTSYIVIQAYVNSASEVFVSLPAEAGVYLINFQSIRIQLD